MASHQDTDHGQFNETLKDLQRRAEIMKDLGKNTIQQGKPIRRWRHESIVVEELDEDMNGVLRVSIGGGEDFPPGADYCRFRGDQSKCIRLLERALKAMKST